jgi:uncharacterized protein YndB with AHSA1/START domain
MIRIETSVSIAAPPERVWDVLTDFGAFPDWNPLVLRAAVEARVGARLRLLIAQPDGSGVRRRLSARIDEWRPGERLGWTGGPWPIFRGHHWFDLTPQDGGTLLRHGETMSGLYPWLSRRTIGARFRPGYEAMNEALVRRLEELGASRA